MFDLSKKKKKKSKKTEDSSAAGDETTLSSEGAAAGAFAHVKHPISGKLVPFFYCAKPHVHLSSQWQYSAAQCVTQVRCVGVMTVGVLRWL